ncbi:MAG TPA: hypothetical protein VGR14_07990 [Verrucomicrobiae bacterium]|jgi:hypothetical protein|nr:hypothetical protein [Verrucomicrobiae bacterium]
MKTALPYKALLLALFALALCGAMECRATVYVISTDGVPLNTNLLADIGAASGLTSPGYVFFSPTNLGQINGTPIYFTGYDSDSAAVFGIAGDLNLYFDDVVLGVGGKFLRLEVGNNANIAVGAKVSLQGLANFADAGGGAGGAGGHLGSPGTTISAPGGIGLDGSDNNGGNGSAGGAGEAAAIDYEDPYVDVFDWIYPWAGKAGFPGLACLADGGVGGTNYVGPGEIMVSYSVTNAAGGAGGGGGETGGSATFESPAYNGAGGGNGSPGAPGANGFPGNPGGCATVPSGTPLLDDGLLHGGAGGGGGEQAGIGLAGGAGGGGGGGGQGGSDILGDQGSYGGNGGFGGTGGYGGSGGAGGNGGSGGGGLELIVQGTLTLNGAIVAYGADGQAGLMGDPGTNGTPGLAGQSGQPGENFPTYGGTGGTGGTGGPGGAGGTGGQGGGGLGRHD